MSGGNLHAFLTSTLYRGSGQRHAMDAYRRGNSPLHPLITGLQGLRPVLDISEQRKIFCSAGNKISSGSNL